MSSADKTKKITLLSILILVISVFGNAFAQETDKPLAVCYDHESGNETIVPVSESASEADLTVSEGAAGSPAEIEVLKYAEEDDTEDDVPSYAIFGRDERQIIKFSPNNKPYTAVVRIFSDQGSCSGAMIGPHYVLTAAHCLYDKAEGGWVKKLEVCPAVAGNNKPYGCSDWSQVWIMGEFDYGENQNYDVGLIELKDAIGYNSGWFGWSLISDSECYQYAMILGYASDYDMQYMFSAEGYLNGTTGSGKRLRYEMDTLPGSSGGPIIIPYDNKWDYIVGIHAHNSGSTNYGVRFTREVLDFVNPYWGK